MFLEFDKESIQKAFDEHGIKHEVTLAYIDTNNLYCIVCKNNDSVDDLTHDAVSLMYHDYMIVGSDALDHFIGTKNSNDIDIWVDDNENLSAEQFVLPVFSHNKIYLRIDPDIEYERKRPVQVEPGKLFDFANFDLTACKIGMRLNDDKIYFYFTAKSFADILARRCGYHKIFMPYLREDESGKRPCIDYQQIYDHVSFLIETKIEADVFEDRFKVQLHRIKKYEDRGFDMYPSEDADLLTTLVNNSGYLE